jgi:hypothetical protein
MCMASASGKRSSDIRLKPPTPFDLKSRCSACGTSVAMMERHRSIRSYEMFGLLCTWKWHSQYIFFFPTRTLSKPVFQHWAQRQPENDVLVQVLLFLLVLSFNVLVWTKNDMCLSRTLCTRLWLFHAITMLTLRCMLTISTLGLLSSHHSYSNALYLDIAVHGPGISSWQANNKYLIWWYAFMWDSCFCYVRWLTRWNVGPLHRKIKIHGIW